tara:strand:+ start:3571 stop:3777 length:207 start_codon:yes stop_codon:yes gene_type:complete
VAWYNKQDFLRTMVESKSKKVNSPIKLDKKPSNRDGENGDRRIVKTNNKTYLYYKIRDEWYKTELEKA